MKAEEHQKLKENIADIYAEFNLILEKRGLHGLRIRNFRVMDATLLNCKDLREMVRSDGTTYLKCFDD